MSALFRHTATVSALTSLLLTAHVSLAQDRQEAKRERIRITDATLKAAQRGVLHVVNKEGDQFYVKVPDRSQDVSFIGSAEPDWLQRGMLVRFTSKFDKKLKPVGEVGQLTVFTPSEDKKVGVFPDSGLGGGDIKNLFSSDDKPKKPVEETTSYLIAGTLVSVKGNKIMVRAGGATVKTELSEKPQVSVDVGHLNFMREGDKVTIDGWFYPEKKQLIYANRLTVSAAEPLGSKKKKTPSKKRDNQK